MRTIVASTNTAVARPRPIIFTVGSSPSTKLRNTQIMISAADVMTRAVAAMPSITASVVVVAGAQVLLADAAEQEHLVVHRQPEQDREHHHRDEAARSARLVRRRTGLRPQPHWNTATITP